MENASKKLERKIEQLEELINIINEAGLDFDLACAQKEVDPSPERDAQVKEAAHFLKVLLKTSEVFYGKKTSVVYQQ